MVSSLLQEHKASDSHLGVYQNLATQITLNYMGHRVAKIYKYELLKVVPLL